MSQLINLEKVACIIHTKNASRVNKRTAAAYALRYKLSAGESAIVCSPSGKVVRLLNYREDGSLGVEMLRPEALRWTVDTLLDLADTEHNRGNSRKSRTYRTLANKFIKKNRKLF